MKVVGISLLYGIIPRTDAKLVLVATAAIKQVCLLKLWAHLCVPKAHKHA
jgi:hypothetical protein